MKYRIDEKLLKYIKYYYTYYKDTIDLSDKLKYTTYNNCITYNKLYKLLIKSHLHLKFNIYMIDDIIKTRIKNTNIDFNSFRYKFYKSINKINIIDGTFTYRPISTINKQYNDNALCGICYKYYNNCSCVTSNIIVKILTNNI
jgi:hypothetical protein